MGVADLEALCPLASDLSWFYQLPLKQVSNASLQQFISKERRINCVYHQQTKS
jgi:hypothetical protein